VQRQLSAIAHLVDQVVIDEQLEAGADVDRIGSVSGSQGECDQQP